MFKIFCENTCNEKVREYKWNVISKLKIVVWKHSPNTPLVLENHNMKHFEIQQTELKNNSKCVTEAFGAYFLTKQTAPAKIFRENLRYEKINSISFQNKKGEVLRKGGFFVYMKKLESFGVLCPFWSIFSFGLQDNIIF